MGKKLEPGIGYELRMRVGESRTVPALFPEAEELQKMPKVFATGFLVAFIEWSCIRAVNPYIDWPRQQTVGTGIDLKHIAPTPPDMLVTAKVFLTGVEGRKLTFKADVFDEMEKIAEAVHTRFIVDKEKFLERIEKKQGHDSFISRS